MTKTINMLNYPLTLEGHLALLKDFNHNADSMGAIPLAHRVIDYAYRLAGVEASLKNALAEVEMLKQRVECMRAKAPACSCKHDKEGFRWSNGEE